MSKLNVLAAVGDTSGLANWLKGNIIPIVLIGIAVIVLARSGNKDHRGALTTVAIVLVGLAVLGLAIGGGAANVGTWLSRTVFGS